MIVRTFCATKSLYVAMQLLCWFCRAPSVKEGLEGMIFLDVPLLWYVMRDLEFVRLRLEYDNVL